MKILRVSMGFPKNFFFGTATSSYQIEGENRWSDWWAWEQQGKIKNRELSGKLCDFWNQPEKYIALNKKLGANAFKISLEWARLNPAENQWDDEALEHYRKIIQEIKRQGMEPIVGLWHFSLPNWFSQKGGWQNPGALTAWQEYVARVKGALDNEVAFWITLNEPSIYSFKGYLEASWPPGKRNPLAAILVRRRLIQAHQIAYALLKHEQNLVTASLNLSCIELQHRWFFLEQLLASLWRQYSDWGFLSQIRGQLDFLALNYYFHDIIDLNPFRFRRRPNEANSRFSDLGWEIYPQGIYQVTKDAYRLCQKPIVVMENGLADNDDKFRSEFIQEHLQWLFKAKQAGVPIKGYLHWSLTDNFEWQEGKAPRFGLVEMDYATLQASPRPSFWFYQKLIAKYQGL